MVRTGRGLLTSGSRFSTTLVMTSWLLRNCSRAFPERYRQRMTVSAEPDTTTKALDSAATFCQSFGQIQGLYAENYPK